MKWGENIARTRESRRFQRIIIGLTRVETKIDGFGNVRDVAIEAQQSVKNAHLRMDRLDKLVFWIGTTAIGAVITGGIMDAI